MTNLDIILESIKTKAEEEKKQILEEAKTQAKEIKDKEKEESNKEVSQILDRAEKDRKLILANESLSSSRMARDIKIAAKNDLIDKLVKKLIEELKKLDRPAYKKFVKNRLKDFPPKKAEILLMDGMDHAFESDELKGLDVSCETVDEGFVIRDGNVVYDNTFSALVDYEKDEIKKIISDQLFSKDKI